MVATAAKALLQVAARGVWVLRGALLQVELRGHSLDDPRADYRQGGRAEEERRTELPWALWERWRHRHSWPLHHKDRHNLSSSVDLVC